GEITWCNRVWREYAGAGAGISFFEALAADELAPTRTAWREAVRMGGALERELRLRSRGGDFRWHLLRVVPERDAYGNLAGFIATATDIDQHKRIEEKNRELLAAAQGARAQAEVANRTKDEFLATVSHELRTPL